METQFNADLYNYGNLEQGVFPGLESPDKIYELAKAMSATSQTGQQLVGDLTAGAALKTESLDPMLKILTNQDRHIVLHKMLPKQQAYNTVEEFNQLIDYGLDTGIFNTEGETPQFTDSLYRRESALIKYTGISGEVTHPFTLVRLGSGVGDALAQEVKNKTQFLIRALDKAYPVANSRNISTEFDGIFRQHYVGVTGSTDNASWDKYFNDSTVVDARGSILTDSLVAEAAHAVVNDNFGMVSQIFAPPIVFSNYAAQFTSMKVALLGYETTKDAVGGQSMKQIATQYGDADIVSDIFWDWKASKASSAAATHAKAPSAPVADATTPAAAVTDTENKFGSAFAGDYYYAVTARNRYGESALVSLTSSALNIEATESADLKFSHTDGAYAAESFVIYKTEKDANPSAGAKFYPVIELTRTDLTAGFDGGTTGVVRDRNRFIPNTYSAVVTENSLDVWGLKQLAPIMRMDLARTSPAFRFMILAYLTLVLYAPKKLARIINIGTITPS